MKIYAKTQRQHGNDYDTATQTGERTQQTGTIGGQKQNKGECKYCHCDLKKRNEPK